MDTCSSLSHPLPLPLRTVFVRAQNLAGEHLLLNMAGNDATGVYHAFHTPHGSGHRAEKILGRLPQVGELATAGVTPLTVAFKKLREEVDRDGLYKTRLDYYLCMAAWLVFLLGSAIYLTTHATSALATLVAASAFALFLQQCAFVGHDSGACAFVRPWARRWLHGCACLCMRVCGGDGLGGLDQGTRHMYAFVHSHTHALWMEPTTRNPRP
jgi:hypothetical protein